MKFQANGGLCPICGKPKYSSLKGHIAGQVLHPACSRKMQQMSEEKKKVSTPRMRTQAVDYFAKTDEYK